MKMNQRKYLSIIFLMLCYTSNSQDLWVKNSLKAILSSHASVYTIGNITYKDQLKKSSATLGDVQYVYDIYSLNLKENNAGVSMKLYPNLTSTYTLMEIDNYISNNMSYQ